MTSQTFDEDDRAFEQRLLGAGRAEALPHERTEAALPSGVVGGAALPESISSVRGSVWSRFLATAKWVALGAVAGGVATFFWVRQAAPPRADRPPVTVEQARAASASSRPLGESRPISPAPPAVTARPATRHATRTAVTPSARPTTPAADLAAEVAALDGVRTALAIGAWSDAEQQLTRYRQIFVDGALRTEAEVLAIEALRGQGREQAAASAAERFVGQHPRDPQVARVRALTE